MTESGRPRVRVGIVSWNTAALLDRCLDALHAALGQLDADVVVVDNASSDGSATVARRHAEVQLLENDRNLGYARGMNQALGAGGVCPFLIALNPDTQPPPGSLESLVLALESMPDVGLVVPRLTNEDGSLQHSCYRFPSPGVSAGVSFLTDQRLRRGLGERLWLEGHAGHDRTTDIDWAIGAVHVIRSDALEDPVRPYSERSFMYAEDLDLCWRLDQRGWRRRLVANVTIPHVANAAGAQAWGEGRRLQWLAATYDWYEHAKGAMAARAWAGINFVATLWVALRSALLVWARVGDRDRYLYRRDESLRMMVLHARALAGGAGPLLRRAAASREE